MHARNIISPRTPRYLLSDATLALPLRPSPNVRQETTRAQPRAPPSPPGVLPKRSAGRKQAIEG
eukprot:9617412-Alexandrium_andersonii.AAC.1